MADDNVTPIIRKALDPLTDGSGGWIPPTLDYGMRFKDYGSLGLRQFGGWVREEFIPDLIGRQAARTYREMMDNSAAIGSMLFTIQQSMRKMEWKVELASDKAEAQAEAEFVDTLRDDMSHTWSDFMIEALSMLPYGYSVHEIVYKRRLGEDAVEINEKGQAVQLPASKYEDGRIGWRRLPIRGQDTVLKWFFDADGQLQGVTQQPWVGTLIDIPIEKMLLFRPFIHKGNPEGRSVLRTAYRSWYFIKRLEELEAILFERMGGLPVVYLPSSLIDAASAQGPGANAAAKAAYEVYKNLVTNVRVDDQMGVIMPSDVYRDAEGRSTGTRMYEFKFETPQHGRSQVNANETIGRYKLDMMMTVLVDFLLMGHDVRGAQNLAVTKVDLFNQAIEGWLEGIADIFNRYALPRLWKMNGLDRKLMPHLKTEMPRRLDMDAMGWLVRNLAQAGMPLFPDEELENYIRDAAGMPALEGENTAAIEQAQALVGAGGGPSGAGGGEGKEGAGGAGGGGAPSSGRGGGGGGMGKSLNSPEALRTMLYGAVAREIKRRRAA